MISVKGADLEVGGVWVSGFINWLGVGGIKFG